MTPIPLSIEGANPLGFLSALGTICLLTDEMMAGGDGVREVRLRWTAGRNPVLIAAGLADGAALVGRLAELARRSAPGEVEAQKEKTARALFEEARRQERKRKDDIKKRRLPRDQRAQALESEHAPLARHAASLRTQWLAARAKAAPDLTVSMGLELKLPSDEFADHCREALANTTMQSRRWVNICASFGVQRTAADRMVATPFALGSASGHQEFLGTASKLMVGCTEDHIRRALLEPWIPTDEGCSFRWDPADDRRYALLAEDPSDDKPKTLWGANRLAFEALRLFTCVVGRDGIATVGWRQNGDAEVWRWPLWTCELSLPVMFSLVASPDLCRDDAESRQRLRARGVFTVFQTRRITVGNAPNQKMNFTPAVPIW